MSGIRIFSISFSLFLMAMGYHQSVDGLKTKSRIVSGIPARDNEFPWLVALKKSRSGPLHGGGTVISEGWVLTAAHCIYDLKMIHLIFGTIFWRNKHSLRMASKFLYPHPEFDTDNYRNDIGLIKLTRPLQFSLPIQPISLVPRGFDPKKFRVQRGIIVGFGNVGDGKPNAFGDLLHALVNIIPNEECYEFYDNIFDTTICSVGIDSNESVCDGDSGGPLIARGRDGKPMQVGVVAFSAEVSCEKNLPSAFTRIVPYLDFISQMTNLTLN